MEPIRTGLVLEGGAMRGLFTCGVLDCFLENGINFDGAIGVSAGAAFGCNFKSKQVGRALRYNLKYMGDKRYCSLRSLWKTGDLFNADFCYRRLPDELDPFDYETYRKNPMEFYAVATDVMTGLPVYKKLVSCDSEDLQFMRASASMPLVSKPVNISGLKLLDGGISDSVPLKHFENLGYNRNVVVLTQPKDYVKKQSRAIHFISPLLGKYPNLVLAMQKRPDVYNNQTSRVFTAARAGRILVICPDEPLGISRIEKNHAELERVYTEGKKIALRRLNEVRAFLNPSCKV